MEAFGNLGIGTVLSFIYGWELTLVIIGFLPFLIVAGLVNVKLVDKFSKKDSKAFKAASQVCYLTENEIDLYSIGFVAIYGSSQKYSYGPSTNQRE